MTTEARDRRLSGRIAGHACLVALSAFSLVPIAWMYLTAFRPPQDVLDQSLLSGSFSLDNFANAFDALPIAGILVNTTLMAAGVALGTLVTSLLAAYALGCWRFRGDRFLFVLFIATWLVPFQVIMVPDYVLLSDLGLLDTLPGVILPQLAIAFAVVLLRQHMRSFPRELLDAARMDGLSSWRTLWTVVVPNLRAPLAALGILYFVIGWNEYFWPLIVFSEPNSVAQIALKSFITEGGTDYGTLMAATGLLCLPILVFYVALQRHVIDVFVKSGLK